MMLNLLSLPFHFTDKAFVDNVLELCMWWRKCPQEVTVVPFIHSYRLWHYAIIICTDSDLFIKFLLFELKEISLNDQFNIFKQVRDPSSFN